MNQTPDTTTQPEPTAAEQVLTTADQPPAPIRRTKHQRRKALYKSFTNTPTQHLLDLIRVQDERIAELGGVVNALIERHNKVALIANALAVRFKVMDEALGWVMQATGVTGPPDKRTEGGLILPPGVELPPAPPSSESEQGKPTSTMPTSIVAP